MNTILQLINSFINISVSTVYKTHNLCPFYRVLVQLETQTFTIQGNAYAAIKDTQCTLGVSTWTTK